MELKGVYPQTGSFRHDVLLTSCESARLVGVPANLKVRREQRGCFLARCSLESPWAGISGICNGEPLPPPGSGGGNGRVFNICFLEEGNSITTHWLITREYAMEMEGTSLSQSKWGFWFSKPREPIAQMERSSLATGGNGENTATAVPPFAMGF